MSTSTILKRICAAAIAIMTIFFLMLVVSFLLAAIETSRSGDHHFHIRAIALRSLALSVLPIIFILLGTATSFKSTSTNRYCVLALRITMFITSLAIAGFTWWQLAQELSVFVVIAVVQVTFVFSLMVLFSLLLDWLYWHSTKDEKDDENYLAMLKQNSHDVFGLPAQLQGVAQPDSESGPGDVTELSQLSQGHHDGDDGNSLFSSMIYLPRLTQHLFQNQDPIRDEEEALPLLHHSDSDAGDDLKLL
ncbi:hypothetical protein JVU11DRAFT_7415 [Chiua virens]|nr:hypothetical protein JVU11DRAFT_7415 [Chiua virens]